MLGKRKRDTRVVARPSLRSSTKQDIGESASSTSSSPSTSPADLDAIFKRHFEASFDPLPELPAKIQPVTIPDREKHSTDEESNVGVQDEDGDEDGDEDESESEDGASEVSDWSGLSESGDETLIVEVVDHAISSNGQLDDELARSRQKAFMTSRPPRASSPDRAESRKGPAQEEDDPTDKLNLKHDIDLQRLLKESHLLDKAGHDPAKQRQMTLDMRLQELGAKQSIYTQQKMPASHRKGITKKADFRETKRRKEAKENGVVLEKVSGKKNDKSGHRLRGVDVPGVGKFAGGTLKLSRHDVASIQGPPTSGLSRGKPKAKRGKRR